MLDLLADILEPYKEIVGTLAAIVTMSQMFSGTFVCWDIYKQGNTRGIGFVPFLGGIVMGILQLQFAYILRDNKMINVNLLGLAISIIYCTVYFYYTEDKMKAWRQIGMATAFCAALLGYIQLEDPKLVEHRFGTIFTALMFYLIASPLFALKDVIKNKSTESMGIPFSMVLSGSVVTFIWLLYSIILRNKFLLMQNLIATVLCSTQLALFVIYPSKPKSQDNELNAKKAI